MKRTFYILLFLLLGSCNQKSPLDIIAARNQTPDSQQGVISPTLSVIENEPAGPNCQYGGKKIDVGKDKNANGQLETSEFEFVKYACNERGVFKTLVISMKEPAGPNCEYGGKIIKSGPDINGNGILDGHEVEKVEYVCTPKPTYKVLTETVEEPFGENCALGGAKIISGEDLNSNGKLEDSEIQDLHYKCNSSADFKVLVVETAEPEGQNCELGGKAISSGLDLNKNDVLDDNEVTDTQYVCSKESDFKYIVAIEEEPFGSNCSLGGKKVITGYDLNEDSLLEGKEIKETSYKCNTEADFDALTSVSSIEFGSADCALGGQKILVGLDLNRNGDLDSNEVDSSKTILNCLTQNDFADVSRVTELAFRSSECALGGQRIEKGKDYNSNGVLDDNEVISSTVACKSNNDFNSLVVIEELPIKDANCSLGGKKSTSGTDYNYNGVLDSDEVNNDSITYSCYTSKDYAELLAEIEEPMGENCRYGGMKINKGLDFNKDGILNLDEINDSLTSYNCLGPEDFNTLVVVSEEPFGSVNCALGGKRTETGLDIDRDGVLAESEISNVVYACYQQDYFNIRNKITEEPEGANCSLGGKKVEQGRDYNGNGVLDAEELDPALTSYNCYSPLDFNLLSKVFEVAKGPECKLGGTKIEKGRDTNSNGILDASEIDPAQTSYACTVSFENSKIVAGASTVASGSSVLFTLTLVDELGLNVKRAGINVQFIVSGGGSSLGEFGPVVDNGDGTYSSLFTGITAGTAIPVSAIVEGKEVTTAKPSIRVIVGSASAISIETKADGTGALVDTLNLSNATPVTLYAISRDVNGNFVANEAVNWTVNGNIGSISTTSGASVTLSPRPANGTGSISMTHQTLGGSSTGSINVSWSGLVAAFDFDDDTLTDLSGNGNNGVNYGATFVEGKRGKAAQFKGSVVSGTAYYPHITIKNSASLSLVNSGTTAAWVYMDGYTNYGGIISKGNLTNVNDQVYSLQLYSSSQKITMNVKDKPSKNNSVYGPSSSFGTPPTGKWFFVVGEWDPTGVRVYINGVLKGANNAKSVAAQITTGDVHIGSLFAGLPYPSKNAEASGTFVGKIDDVSIWNRALSDSEILYLYNNGNGR